MISIQSKRKGRDPLSFSNTKIMKRSKRILDFLIKKGHINLDDFYTISISHWDITLQGLYTHTKAKKYTPKGSVNDCGFVKKDYKVGNILIHVILTS